jgi:hypothetical protein
MKKTEAACPSASGLQPDVVALSAQATDTIVPATKMKSGGIGFG